MASPVLVLASSLIVADPDVDTLMTALLAALPMMSTLVVLQDAMGSSFADDELIIYSLPCLCPVVD
jgi:hypothetical protein